MKSRFAAASLISLASLIVAAPALAQNALLQAGPTTPGDMPMYSGSGGFQPLVIDGGGAGGGPLGSTLGQIGITARSQTGVYPSANSGAGPDAEHACIYDGPITNATGYHYFCMDPNAQGGGLMSYGAGGAATQLPFHFIVNGASYAFPFTVGGIIGPGTTVPGDIALWNNTTGTLLKDVALLPSVNGGLGAASLTGLLVGNGASAATAISPGTGVTSALGSAVNGSGGFLTYAIIGTSGSAVPLLNANNTWSGTATFNNAVTIATSDSAASQIVGSNFQITDTSRGAAVSNSATLTLTKTEGLQYTSTWTAGVTNFGLVYTGVETSGGTNDRIGASFVQECSAPSQTHSCVGFTAAAEAGANGTAAIYTGGYSVAYVPSGYVTSTGGAVAWEADTHVYSPVNLKNGFRIADEGIGAYTSYAGSVEDAALEITNSNPGGATNLGWNALVEFGEEAFGSGYKPNFPIRTGGVAIQMYNLYINSGSPGTVLYAIEDYGNVTAGFTREAMILPLYSSGPPSSYGARNGIAWGPVGTNGGQIESTALTTGGRMVITDTAFVFQSAGGAATLMNIAYASGTVGFNGAAEFNAASSWANANTGCGALSGSSAHCFVVFNPNGNPMSIPVYGSY